MAAVMWVAVNDPGICGSVRLGARWLVWRARAAHGP
jgi:hypothetical protein